MQVYLVGGAVRDKVLNRPYQDADYVVVGATVEQMLAQGFVQVGADFPVFLHPKNKQEYALARTERKSGEGYKGFSVYASAEVTLEEDLIRRDLTINAMAIEVNGLFDSTEKTGDVIDPYGGLKDIENKQLRHVSTAFAEDPLRVLRVARFYSRLYEHGFAIADETLMLMKEMVANNELNHLSRERIWTESQRATMQDRADIYWQNLYDIGALTLFAPLAMAWQDKQIQLTALMAVQHAAKLNLTIEQRWAVILASLINYENDTNLAHKTLNQTNTIPKKISSFALKVSTHYHELSNINKLNANELMQLLQNISAHKEPATINELLTTVQVIETAKAQILLDKVYASYHSVGMQDIASGLKGKAIGDALYQKRVELLKEANVK